MPAFVKPTRFVLVLVAVLIPMQALRSRPGAVRW